MKALIKAKAYAKTILIYKLLIINMFKNDSKTIIPVLGKYCPIFTSFDDRIVL